MVSSGIRGPGCDGGQPLTGAAAPGSTQQPPVPPTSPWHHPVVPTSPQHHPEQELSPAPGTTLGLQGEDPHVEWVGFAYLSATRTELSSCPELMLPHRSHASVQQLERKKIDPYRLGLIGSTRRKKKQVRTLSQQNVCVRVCVCVCVCCVRRMERSASTSTTTQQNNPPHR